MERFRPRRSLLAEAFERALRGEHAPKIDLSGLGGMNIDAAFMILKKTESLREAYGRDGGTVLRSTVRRAAVASGLPPDRRYAYEVVLMNYYGLIKGYQTKIKKKREARLGESRRKLAEATKAA